MLHILLNVDHNKCFPASGLSTKCQLMILFTLNQRFEECLISTKYRKQQVTVKPFTHLYDKSWVNSNNTKQSKSSKVYKEQTGIKNTTME